MESFIRDEEKHVTAGASTGIPAPLPFKLGKGNLGWNTLLNFAGQTLPLVAGVALIPYIIKRLGPDRFGILGIVWVIFGYFSLFDFGLGRATTKFLAEWLAAGEVRQITDMVWTSIAIQFLLGLAGGLIFLGVTPLLVGRVLKPPAYLAGEIRMTFIILAAALPAVLVTSGLRAVIEGCQRFDLSNSLRIPSSVSGFLIPAIALPFGLRLPGIVLLLALSRAGFALAHLILCIHILPCLKARPVFRGDVIFPLLSFGGWVTVANLVNPIMVSMDRFFIGSLLSVAMVGYYTAPMEAVTKLWIIPGSLMTTMFPVCSALGIGKKEELQVLYSRTIKCLFLILAPITLVLILFARQIMQLWLGPVFVANSALVLQILSFGVFVNCFAHVPYGFLQGLGRPDAASKLLLAEFLPYTVLVWLMIRHSGIAGAAEAWSIRVTVEVLFLFLITWRIFSLSPRLLADPRILRSLTAMCALALAILATKMAVHSSILLEAFLSAIWMAAFAFAVWRYIFDNSDRGSVLALLDGLRNATKGESAA